MLDIINTGNKSTKLTEMQSNYTFANLFYTTVALLGRVMHIDKKSMCIHSHNMHAHYHPTAHAQFQCIGTVHAQSDVNVKKMFNTHDAWPD